MTLIFQKVFETIWTPDGYILVYCWVTDYASSFLLWSLCSGQRMMTVLTLFTDFFTKHCFEFPSDVLKQKDIEQAVNAEYFYDT